MQRWIFEKLGEWVGRAPDWETAKYRQKVFMWLNWLTYNPWGR